MRGELAATLAFIGFGFALGAVAYGVGMIAAMVMA